MSLDLTSIVFSIRLLLAAIFLTAGLMKLKHGVADQSDMLQAIGFRPGTLLQLLLRVLPFLELALAIWLSTAKELTGSLIFSCLLLLLFTCVLLAAIRATYAGRCACFGSAGHSSVGMADVISNSLLIVGIVIALGAISVFPVEGHRPLWRMNFTDGLALGFLTSWFLATR